MIVDYKVYHIGASIKDLGKKWFAFSLMEAQDADEIIIRLNSLSELLSESSKNVVPKGTRPLGS